MNYQYLEACLNTVLGEVKPYSVTASPAEIQVVTQDEMWIGKDRPLVRNALQSVMYAGLDVMGLQRSQLAAEYIACCIVICAKEVNWKIACNYISDDVTTRLDVITGYKEEREQVTDSQLFAMCIAARDKAEEVGINLADAFAEAMEMEVVNLESTG